jgi:HTH-type transcriptional regulator/antitoxin HigA
MTKIENEIQYNWAVAKVEQLLPLVNENTPETDSNYIELNLLSNLVADYSEIHFAIGEPALKDVLQLRMFEMGLTQKKMSELLEVSQSRISAFLSGKNEPTLQVGRLMSKRLNIDPAIVLGV